MPNRRPVPPRKRTGLPLPAVIGVGALAVVIGVVVAMTTAGNGDQAGTAASTDMAHIHGLVIDPADGALYAGTHHGVFRISATGDAARVGDNQQDMMGFVVIGPGRFLGSGHPAANQAGPAHLGLIESTDTARTWQPRSLRGQADFHSLRYLHNTVYGYNSTTGTLMVSTDMTTWQSRASLELSSFVVSPDDASLLLAATPHGLARSTDGGATWTHAADMPVAMLDWQRSDRLWAVSTTGEVSLSTDGARTWIRRGTADGQPTALTSRGDTLYLALAGASIQRSADGGATWAVLRR